MPYQTSPVVTRIPPLYYIKFWRHFNLAILAIFLKIAKLKCTKIKCRLIKVRSATWNSAIWSVSHNHGIWPVWRSIMVLVHERSIEFVWRCKWVRTALRYDITITVSFVSFKIKIQNIVWFCFKWSCWRPWFYHKNFLYCSIVVVKVLNTYTLIDRSFSSWNREN